MPLEISDFSKTGTFMIELKEQLLAELDLEIDRLD
jgi:hypothetical protein